MIRSASNFPPLAQPTMAQPSAWRAGPLATIILLHLLLVYGLQSGLFKRVVQAAPEQIFISLIRPKMPQPAQPIKTVRIVKNVIPTAHFAPAVNLAPAPEAIVLNLPAPTLAVQAPTALAALAAPVPVPAAEPRTISSALEYIRPPRPEYPSSARRLREEGKILLRVLVNAEGLAEQAVVQKSSGFSRLDDAARRAVLAALFKPHREDGRPIAVYALIPISFQLES
jgi:protein TonB